MAAILFVVAYNMSDVPNFIRLIRVAPRADSLILLITFFLTIFTDLVRSARYFAIHAQNGIFC